MNQEEIEALDHQEEVVENEVEQIEGETPESEAAEEPADEVVVTIGEESTPSDEDENQRAPEWVRELRKSNRELSRRNRELEQQAQVKPTSQEPVALGIKPTLEGSDYDAEKFERDLEAWHQRKYEVDAVERKKQDEATIAQAVWQSRLDAYGKLKGELKVQDYEDAELAVQEVLSVTQQGVILHGAKNPALLVYALGKNPKKAKELAAITDPVKFAFAAADLENQLKVTPRKTAPLPETRVRGSAPVSGTVDSRLATLQAEADKSGDRSKVAAYLRSKRA